MLVPDLLHEFELGVWKGTFAHLCRLLAAQGSNVLAEFNHRLVASWLFDLPTNIPSYRMRDMPTFGREKIRKFWNDVSSRKKLAARDYEDFLIVSLLRSPPAAVQEDW